MHGQKKHQITLCASPAHQETINLMLWWRLCIEN